MSGYPYGNPSGGYPPQPTMGGSGYPNYPPAYNDNQSCASLYGTPAPPSNINNYPPGPYDSYGANQIPNMPYGGNNIPPQPSFGGQMPQPSMYNSPPQNFGNYGNPQNQSFYPPPNPSASTAPIYPNTQPLPNYNQGGTQYPPYQQQGFYPQEQLSIMLANLEQYQGTVYPAPNFNAEADCHTLRNSMKGAGTNEHAIISIAANRSNMQRQQIKYQYTSMFGVDLVKELSGELSGHFKETISALFDIPANYEAYSIHQALSFGREGTLREILLTRSNGEIRALVDAYRRLYNKDLLHDINHHVRGTDFKRLLTSAAQANREELTPQQVQQARQMGIESVIDRNRARQDAHSLYKAGAGKLGTDERTFNAIFTQRSYQQLRATFEEYYSQYRKDIAHVIKSEFSGDTEDAYLTLIKCIRDRPTFFAERLHKAISGLGTKDSNLIRIIVTRSEIDLAQIKQRYQQLYNRPLAHDVGGDTSGDYKRILLAILK